MVRFRLLSLSLLLLVAACSDTLAPRPSAPDPEAAIVDARDPGAGGAPNFFWLPPMVDQPPTTLLGDFEVHAAPEVIVVCHDPYNALTCDDETPLVGVGGIPAVFTLGDGLTAESDHFKVEFDTDVFNLMVSIPGSEVTYRIIAQIPVPELGIAVPLGWVDFQVGDNGRAAKSLATDETVGLVDGRTLPIKFRIDDGAYDYVAEQIVDLDLQATDYPDDGDEPLCQRNCSVTVISPDATTLATLSETGLGVVTAMQFLPGDVETVSLLIIDERTTFDENESENCAPDVDLDKRYCYRYIISPDVPFANPDGVRFGICPRNLEDDEDYWHIHKANYEDGALVDVELPPSVDVSDFLPCDPPPVIGMLRGVFRYAANWLVPPLHARGKTPPWGGTAKDLSDLFWGSVDEFEIDPSTPTVAPGATDQLTVPRPAAGVTWSSSNPAVATVSSTGLVTGVSLGTATITATYGEESATATVTVSSGPIIL